MERTLEAIYEGGLLRPLEPLDLPERQRVTVTVAVLPTLPQEEEWLDQEYAAHCAAEADPTISLEAVRQSLAKIPGALTDDFIAERDDR